MPIRPRPLPPNRLPVPEGLPDDLGPGERRRERMRLVAARRLAGLTVALDNVHDPHNISAVLRSCDGFGLQHVHLVGLSADPNRAVSMGCEKWLTLHRHVDAPACATALRAAGYELWAAMPDRDARPIEQVDFTRPIALVFGAERDGLSEALLNACDGRYQIYMPGFSQSLNVSVAAAISIHIGATARRKALAAPTDLRPEEIDALAAEWIRADEERRRRGKVE
jgi:tRNA (guanosine-2'-O-)-methyltransferase